MGSLQIKEEISCNRNVKNKNLITVTWLCNLYILGIFQLARDVIIILQESDYEFGISVLKTCPRVSKLP